MAEEGRRIRSRKALLIITAKQSFVNAKSILRACFAAPLEERSFSFTVSPPGTTRPLRSPRRYATARKHGKYRGRRAEQELNRFIRQFLSPFTTQTPENKNNCHSLQVGLQYVILLHSNANAG